jgi:hypothetical protein
LPIAIARPRAWPLSHRDAEEERDNPHEARDSHEVHAARVVFRDWLIRLGKNDDDRRFDAPFLPDPQQPLQWQSSLLTCAQQQKAAQARNAGLLAQLIPSQTLSRPRPSHSPRHDASGVGNDRVGALLRHVRGSVVARVGECRQQQAHHRNIPAGHSGCGCGWQKLVAERLLGLPSSW